MDKPLIHVALTTIAVIFSYAVLARGLLNATEPFRTRALDAYGRMIKSGHCTPEIAARLDRHLDEIYSSLAAWRLVFLLLCAVVIMTFRAVTFQQSEKLDWAGLPVPLKADYEKFTNYWLIATVANSPVAAMFFTLVGILAMSYLLPVSAISNILSSRDDHYRNRQAAH